MAFMVENCPRCSAQYINFKIIGASKYLTVAPTDRTKVHGDYYEMQCVCLGCKKSTIFNVLHKEGRHNFEDEHLMGLVGNIKEYVSIIGPVTPADLSFELPPEHLPQDIELAFIEGSKCLSINCFNASATMYRLCLDFATKDLLPPLGEEPGTKIRRSLGLRMGWLFDNGLLPEALRDLAECVKDDGNDGAHEGILDEESALDLKDFAYILLERLYTEKYRLEQAKQRRLERKQGSGS